MGKKNRESQSNSADAGRAARRVNLPFSLAEAHRGRTPARHPQLRRVIAETLELRTMLSTYTVNSLADDGTGGTTVNGVEVVTLRWAINQANTNGGDNTINFDPSLTANPTETATITLVNGPLVLYDSDGVTLNGIPGLTINANGSDNAFVNNSGDTAALNDLTITGATGGAIYNSYGTHLTVQNSTITGNTTPSNGAGIINNGTLNIQYSTISGNTAQGYGGGISATYDASTTTIANSTISSNTAYSYNGGDIANDGNLTITASTISYGSSTGNGGDIANDGTLTLTNSTVSHGNSQSFGGGIDNNGQATITTTAVSNNQSFEGGGIFASGDTQITDSTLSGNICPLYGGGIANIGTLQINTSTLSGNTGGDGGAIYSADIAQITDSTVTGNTSAKSGGGVYSNDSSLVIENSTISGNIAGVGESGLGSGGGVADYAGSSSIVDCTIASNQANYYGGGIDAPNGVTITASTITGNQNGAGEWSYPSNSQGAGVFGQATIQSSIVASNTSQLGGVTANDLSGTFNGNNNLIGDGTASDLTGSNNVQGEPSLAPLGNYGGPTETMPLLPGSPYGLGEGVEISGIGADQRGLPLPTASAPDIGAVQSLAAPSGLSIGTFTSSGVDLSWTNPAFSPADENDILISTDGVNYCQLDSVSPSVNTYEATGLDSGTIYYFKVQASEVGVPSFPTAAQSATTNGIPEPEDVSATAVSSGEVDVTWDDPSGLASDFQVQRSGDQGNTWTTLSPEVAASSFGTIYTFTDTTALDGTDYLYQIVGVTSYTWSNPSATAEAVTPVATPTSFTATPASDGSSVTLVWGNPSSDTTGDIQFEIDRSQDSGSTWNTVTVTDAGDTSNTYVDTDVLGQTNYEYRIQALNSVSDSAYATTTVTTPLAVPATPQSLAASNITAASVALSWSPDTTDPGGAVAGYTVSMSTDEGQSYTNLATGLTATGYTASGLNPSSIYLFQVTADNAAGSSDPDGPVGAKTLALSDTLGDVTSLAATAGPTPWNSATLTWAGDTASGSDLEFEEQDVTAGESFHAIPDTLNHTNTSYVALATQLTLGDTYNFRVRTDRADGTVSAWQSSAYTPYTTLSTPSVTVTQTSDGQHLVVGWSGVPTNGYVQIEYMSDAYPDAGWVLYDPYPADTHLSVTTDQAPSLPTGDQGAIEDPGIRSGAGSYIYRVEGFTSANGTYYQPTYWSASDSGALPESAGPAVTGNSTTTSITLNWTGYAPAGATTTYTFFNEQSQPGEIVIEDSSRGGYGVGSISGTSSSSATQAMSFTYTDLTPGVTYNCVIESQCSDGSPAGFTPKDVTTQGAVVPNTPTTLPNSIYSLNAIYVTGQTPQTTGVLVVWADDSNNESGFEIQRSTNDTFSNTNGDTTENFYAGADTGSYFDTTAGPDSIYFYRVTAMGNASGLYNSAPTSVATVNTPGAAVLVGSPDFDVAGNPMLQVDNSSIDPDTGMINPPSADDPNLVTVTAYLPLGADDYGIATLTWSASIRLYDSDMSQVGTLEYNGYQEVYELSWDVSVSASSKLFYGQAISSSSSLGDQFFNLESSLSLLDATSTVSPNPTTQPAATQSVTTISTDISGDCNDDGVVNAQDDAVKATLPVILNLDDQSNGKGLFITPVPSGSLTSVQLFKSGGGQIKVIGGHLFGAGAHIMGVNDGEIGLNPIGLYGTGEWIHAFGEKNGYITVTLVENFVGGGQKKDVITLRVVRADMVFRKGDVQLAGLVNAPVTHGGIDTGDDKIFDLEPNGWMSTTLQAFYSQDIQGSLAKATKIRLSFVGSYMADRIRAALFDDLRGNDVDLPTGTVKFNVFSSADNYDTGNCLEIAEKQWEKAIEKVRSQLTDPDEITEFEDTYYLNGVVIPIVAPIEEKKQKWTMEYILKQAGQPLPGWTFNNEATLVTENGIDYYVLNIIEPNSYLHSSSFKRISF